MTIKAGDIAICSRGELGLVTEDMPQWVTYKWVAPCSKQLGHTEVVCSCEKGYTFVGVHLTEGNGHKIGAPWASRNPRVVGHISSLLAESNILQTILCEEMRLAPGRVKK